MKINSAQFIKSVVGTNESLEDGKPQIVFIGRSNVGKSSLINSLTNQKRLARTSSMPGRTQQINIFLINNDTYFIDLPGYGFAKLPSDVRLQIEKMNEWYLFRSGYDFKKVVLIIDAEIGPTGEDLDWLYELEKQGKNIIVVANKIDKIKKSVKTQKLQRLKDQFHAHPLIPYSAEKKIGVNELTEEIFN